jgi:hypothetical protein
MTREAILQLKHRCVQALLDGQIVANAASKVAAISAQTGPVEPVGYSAGSTGHLLQVCEAALDGQVKAAAPAPAPVVAAPVVEAPVEEAPAADESTEEAPKPSKKGRK